MSGPLDRLFQGPPLEVTLYPAGSRYNGIAIAELVLPDGGTVRYLRRRFLPDPGALVTLVEHRVADRDRLDNLAARYLGDPLAAWRIADANRALCMEALLDEVGVVIRITLPDGVPESSNA